MISAAEMDTIIFTEYKRMTGKEFYGSVQLPDTMYLLPTDNMMSKIYKNYFIPFMEAFQLHYENSFDCDNFGMTYATVHTLLKMGLAVGFIFYYDITKENSGHSVGFYVNNLRQFRKIEPQSDTFNIGELTPNNIMWFGFLEGIK
jgi:hypothetical protein